VDFRQVILKLKLKLTYQWEEELAIAEL